MKSATEAPAPIAAEVVRLWVDLDGGARAALYRAAVKVAYRQRLVPPATGTRARAARTAPKRRGSGRSS